MYDAINRHALRNCSFTEEELQMYNSLLESWHVKRRTFLLQPGEICTFEAYIHKGCIRNYFIDESGSEVVLQLAIEDWWVSDIASFQDQIPASLFIESLEDCELLVLRPDKKEELLRRVPKFERLFRLMVQRSLTTQQNRLIKTISLDAEARYRDFLQHYPDIAHRVPQIHIASYLGMSPEFLSKIKARIARRK